MKENLHLSGMDGLRGILIVFVVLYHLFPSTVSGGFLGVNGFFVLSGCLVMIRSRWESAQGGFSATLFYSKRVKRIYPPLLLSLVLSFFLFSLFYPAALRGVLKELLSVLFGYNNIWQVIREQSYFERTFSVSFMNHLWYLAIEMQFYLIWPLLFFLWQYLRRKNKGNLYRYGLGAGIFLSALLLLILYRPDQDPTRVYFGTDTRLHALLFGVLVGSLFTISPEDTTSLAEIGLLILTGIGYAALCIFLNDRQPFTYRFGIFFSSLLIAIFLFLLLRQQKAARFLDIIPLRYLGSRSFELYLLQYPTQILFVRLFPRSTAAKWISLLLAFLLAELVWQLLHNENLRKIILSGKRSRRVALAVFLIIFLVAAAGVVRAGSSTFANQQQELQTTLEQNAAQLQQQSTGFAQNTGRSKSVTFIGDSVMLGASTYIQEYFPDAVIDAKVSRRVIDGAEVVETLRAEGKLGDVVVISLGMNSIFSDGDGQHLIDTIGRDREIYWVNIYNCYGEDIANEQIQQLVNDNENVKLVDWASCAWDNADADWFYEDGIHLMDAAQQAYADLLNREIKR